MHESLCLSAFVEAPRAAIDAVLAKHATVRDLVANGWLQLHAIDDDGGILRREPDGDWRVPEALARG